MGKYITLILGILMLLGFIIYKIYKICKYSLKVDAEVIKNIRMPYDNYPGGSVGSDNAVRGIYEIPVYKYKYKGLIYHYNNGFGSRSRIKPGVKFKIRINPDKPEKAYVPEPGLSFVYLFINAILLIIGYSAMIV